MSSKTSDQPVTGRVRGRPRGFDKETALGAAVRIFWSRGYEGSSIGDLSNAMGMPKATLYAEFGSKEVLFLAAVAHYADRKLAPVAAALDTATSCTQCLERFFDAVIDLATNDPETPGCLISCVLADAAGSNPRFRAELALRFKFLEERIATSMDRTLCSSGASAAGWPMAGLIAAIARGLMLKARSGANRKELEKVAIGARSALCRHS